MSEPSVSAQQEFAYLLRARNTLFWIVTDEELRAENAVAVVGEKAGMNVLTWDCWSGIRDSENNPVPPMKKSATGKAQPVGDPPGLISTALDHIDARTKSELLILRDAHKELENDHVAVRGIKTVARSMMDELDVERNGALVILSPSSSVPLELRSVAVVINWPLPDRKEIREILAHVAEASGAKLEKGEIERLVESAAGLSSEDIASALARSMSELGAIRPQMVSAYKKRIIERERVLAWWEPDPRGLDSIGGLELLKDWVRSESATLLPGAREFGLRPPRGLLLAGVPGCGKSAMAKAIPAEWGGMPLLRLDLGSLKGPLMGESEANIRKALQVANAMGRVVLWIDEVGKALRGAMSTNTGDSGVSADALGELLFWMQEHDGDSLVVGTTNEFDLPPEFCRRFDATFFVDLPTTVERLAILKVALGKRVELLKGPKVQEILEKTNGFSGDEVTKLYRSGLLLAWKERRDLALEDILAAAEEVVPMSVSAAEKIEGMRVWAQSRARFASLPEMEENASSGKPSTPRGAAGVVSNQRFRRIVEREPNQEGD